MSPQVGGSEQLKLTQTSENPKGAVVTKAIALGELSAPRLVHNSRSSKLRSLDSDFGFTSVFRPLGAAFNHEDFDGALIIVVAFLDKSVFP